MKKQTAFIYTFGGIGVVTYVTTYGTPPIANAGGTGMPSGHREEEKEFWLKHHRDEWSLRAIASHLNEPNSTGPSLDMVEPGRTTSRQRLKETQEASPKD